MRLIALAFAMLVAVGPAAAQSWREYSYPGYFFAVSFPADPKIENTTYQAADGRLVEARVYSVTQGNAVFKMTVVDLSETTIEEGAVIDHAIRTLSQGGEIKLERFRGECLRQFRNLRGPGQAENVREHVRSCVLAKVQAEVGKTAAGQTPSQLLQRLRAECFSQFEAERKKGLDVAQLMRGCIAEKLGSAAPESPNLGDRRSPAAGN
jgi:hypothetical protein